MTDTARNAATIRALYEAFGRGDVPAIIERMHDDVEWEMGAPSGYGVPYLAPGRGRKHVGAFFEALRGIDISDFRVLAVAPDGDYVIGLITITFTVKATGKKVHEAYEPHVWKFDPQGRIVGFRHAVDTAQHAAAQTK